MHQFINASSNAASLRANSHQRLFERCTRSDSDARPMVETNNRCEMDGEVMVMVYRSALVRRKSWRVVDAIGLQVEFWGGRE